MQLKTNQIKRIKNKLLEMGRNNVVQKCGHTDFYFITGK